MAGKNVPEDKKKAKREGGIILFEDEVSFQVSGTIIRTWAEKGVGTEVPSFPCKKSVKVYGAVGYDPETDRYTWHFRFDQVFNGTTWLCFLRQLLRNFPGKKIFLIADNAGYHKGKKTGKWLLENKDRIEIHFLPPYSPKFNATEHVWRETKKRATHNRYFETPLVLKSAVFRCFHKYKRNPDPLCTLVASFF